MLEIDDEILFENILGEPETTRPDEIILKDGEVKSESGGRGDDSCLVDAGCKEDNVCTNDNVCTGDCVKVCAEQGGCTSDGVCTSDGSCTSDSICGGLCSEDCPSDASCPTYNDGCMTQCAGYGYTCPNDNPDCSLYCCANNFNDCNGYATGNTNYYFNYIIGFGLRIQGTYSVNSSLTYNIMGWTGGSRLQQSSGNVTKPFYYMGYNFVQNSLASLITEQNSAVIYIYKSGTTLFRGNATGCAYICGVTIPTTASTAHPLQVYAKVFSGRLKYVTSTTHAARTYVPISCVVAVHRTSSLTNGWPPNSHIACLAVSGLTDVISFEKPISIEVTEDTNVKYRLQGAEISVKTNSGGLCTNKFYTGTLGYIRAFTSGTTATSFQVDVVRSGYTQTTQTFTYHTSSSEPVNHISESANFVRLSKSYYECPNAQRLIYNLSHHSIGELVSYQCRTSSQYLNNNYSAVTGNIYQQSIFTGNQILRFTDCKSFKNFNEYETDEYLTGKEAIEFYNPGVKTNTGYNNSVLITAITRECDKITIQTPEIYVSATNLSDNISIAFRLNPLGNQSNPYHCYLYSEEITQQYKTIPSYIFTYFTTASTLYSYNGFELYFMVYPSESHTGQVTAKTKSEDYWYQPINNGFVINESGITPGGGAEG